MKENESEIESETMQNPSNEDEDVKVDECKGIDF